MRLNGTLQVRLVNELRSADGQRVYLAGTLVNAAIHADADVRVWAGHNPPVIATFKELVGSQLPEATNA
jgi:hypothetical protein